MLSKFVVQLVETVLCSMCSMAALVLCVKTMIYNCETIVYGHISSGPLHFECTYL